MRTTLVSDAHITAIDDPRQAALVEFMASWPTDQWVFVGDILDFGWSVAGTVHWAHVPFWSAVLSALRSGQSVIWVRGNHDFAVHERSLRRVGVSVVDEWSCRVDDQIVGALHGDCLPGALHVRASRWFAKVPFGGIAARVVGSRRTLRLGHVVSALSKRRHSEQRLEQALARQERLVQRYLVAGWDACCVGHTHAPGIVRSANGMHVNLGDWSEHRTFAHIDRDVGLFRWTGGQAVPVDGVPRRRIEWGVGAF